MCFIFKRSLRFLLLHFRPFYCILFGRETDNFIFTRYICAYLFGIFVAWILWKLLLASFRFSMETEFVILAIMFSIIGVGYVFTTSMKCITLLILVGLAGKSGRNYLRALSFAFIISGPLTNLSLNGEEIVRVFSCATTLTYNLTKTRLDLMTKPFQNSLSTMQEDINDVKHAFGKMNDALEPIHQEVLGNDDNKIGIIARQIKNNADDVQGHYETKIKNRCKKQLEMGKERCRATFEKAFKRCEEKFPAIVRFFLCWSFRLDFVCGMNILGNPNKICDPTDAIPDTFGESYVQLEVTQNDFYQKSSNVSVKYEIQSKIPEETSRKAEEIGDSIVKEFKARKRVFDFVMGIMQTIFSLLFIRIIIESIYYHRNYLQQIDFDNVYISRYFTHVDNRRKRDNKTSLLPLKKLEKKHLVDLDRVCRYTDTESRAIVLHLLQLSLESITACFLLLLDFLVATLLDIVRVKSFISYMQEGEHIIRFQIHGVGLMARLLRKILGNFNMHEKVATYLTNEACLPRPKVLPTSFYVKLFFLHFIIVFLIYKSAFFMRLRRLICGYFYRKHEKRRILYLYNNLLRRRRDLYEEMLESLDINIAEENFRRKTYLALRLRLGYRSCFDWLKCFKSGRRRCLVCREYEDKSFIYCKCMKCQAAYCGECWNFMGMHCIACNMDRKEVPIIGTDSDPEQ